MSLISVASTAKAWAISFFGRIRSSLVNSLASEKAPYIVTLFVAAVGWTALRTSDRLQQTPFIEYQTETRSVPQKEGRIYALVHLRNVTSSQLFDCFRIEFLASLTAEFEAKGDNFLLQHQSSIASSARLESTQPFNWRLEIKDFPPGSDLVLGLPIEKGTGFRVLVRSCDTSLANAALSPAISRPPRIPVLLERSVQTRYVENELFVLWCGLLLWLSAMVFINSLSEEKSPSTERRIFKSRRKF